MNGASYGSARTLSVGWCCCRESVGTRLPRMSRWLAALTVAGVSLRDRFGGDVLSLNWPPPQQVSPSTCAVSGAVSKPLNELPSRFCDRPIATLGDVADAKYDRHSPLTALDSPAKNAAQRICALPCLPRICSW